MTILKKLMIVAVLAWAAYVHAQAPAALSAPVSSGQDTERYAVKVVFFPYREAIIASRIDGVVLKNDLLLGHRFRAGDVLARLDDVRFKIEVERVEALEKEGLAQRDFAREALKNQENLFKQNVTSEIDLKKAQLDVEITAARLQAIRANLREVKNQLSYCVIRAPFAGRIEEIVTRNYETVRGGQPLMRIIDDNHLKAVMFAPVALLGSLKEGQEILIDVPAADHGPGVLAKAAVYEIAPRADHRSGTIEVRALVDNSSGEITAGTTGVFYYAKPR